MKGMTFHPERGQQSVCLSLRDLVWGAAYAFHQGGFSLVVKFVVQRLAKQSLV